MRSPRLENVDRTHLVRPAGVAGRSLEDLPPDRGVRARVPDESRHDGGEPTGADVGGTDIAGDGSKVAYSSSVTNIVAGDTNAAADIFVATLPSGGAGNDRIDGGAGDDIINGGAGADYIKGGLGADTMRGGTGNDTYVVDDLGDTSQIRSLFAGFQKYLYQIQAAATSTADPR